MFGSKGRLQCLVPALAQRHSTTHPHTTALRPKAGLQHLGLTDPPLYACPPTPHSLRSPPFFFPLLSHPLASLTPPRRIAPPAPGNDPHPLGASDQSDGVQCAGQEAATLRPRHAHRLAVPRRRPRPRVERAHAQRGGAGQADLLHRFRQDGHGLHLPPVQARGGGEAVPGPNPLHRGARDAGERELHYILFTL